MAYELFNHEKDVIAAANQRLQNDEVANSQAIKAYANLLKEYESLFKETRRLRSSSRPSSREA